MANNVRKKEEIELNFQMVDSVRAGEDRKIKGHIVVAVMLPTDTTSSNICKISDTLRVRKQYFLQELSSMHAYSPNRCVPTDSSAK